MSEELTIRAPSASAAAPRTRAFAWFTIAFAVVHAAGETLFHVRYGQFLPSFIVDWIAVSLLVLGAGLLLARGWSAGVLCGAWGFELCLCYRSFFGRIEMMMNGTASDLIKTTAYILSVPLSIAAIAFVISIRLCSPGQASVSRSPS